MTSDQERIRATVRQGYGSIATGKASSCCGSGASSCCGSPPPEALAGNLGYTEADLACLPEGANMGLSCGNPSAIAELKEGETVLDLGSGGGFDVFIAGRRVKASGRVIGVDMTPEMLAKARANTAAYVKATGFANVEFRLGEIEHLPVADASIDVVLSNCVINLAPDKPQVWRDMARVLKPGGRVVISDLALKKPLPEAVRSSVQALVGCLAGAATIPETERMMTEAGLVDIAFEEKPTAISAMLDANDDLYRSVVAALPHGEPLDAYVAGVTIRARRSE